MKKMPLHVKIMLGLAAGIIWAFASSYLGWNEFTINWIDPFGTIFIRLLKFIAVPLVLFSIIGGVSSLTDITKLGKMGAKTLTLYLITTVSVVAIGLLLVNSVRPGDFIDEQQRIKNRIQYEIWVNETDGVEILDGKHLLSDPKYSKEVAKATGNQATREVEADAGQMVESQKSESESPLKFLVDMVPENIILSISDNQLMLQVIFFAARQ